MDGLEEKSSTRKSPSLVVPSTNEIPHLSEPGDRNLNELISKF